MKASWICLLICNAWAIVGQFQPHLPIFVSIVWAIAGVACAIFEHKASE